MVETRRDKALKRLYADLTLVYNDGDSIPVRLGEPPRATRSGSVVIPTESNYSVDGANDLRLLVDILSHEVEHIRETDLGAKKQFMDDHDGKHPVVAGWIANVVEDAFIDKNRTDRFRGLRKTLAFKQDLLMERGPDISQLPKNTAMVHGLMQISNAGYAKGISNVEDEDVLEFLGYSRSRIDEARRETDFERRKQLALEISEKFVECAEDPAMAEEYIEENIDDLPTDDIEIDEGQVERRDEDLEEYVDPDQGGQQQDQQQQSSSRTGSTIDPDKMEEMAKQAQQGQQGEPGEGKQIPRWLVTLAKVISIGAVLAVIGATVAGMIPLWVGAGILLLMALLWWILRKLLKPPAGAGAAGAGSAGQGQGQGSGGISGYEGDPNQQEQDADSDVEQDGDRGDPGDQDQDGPQGEDPLEQEDGHSSGEQSQQEQRSGEDYTPDPKDFTDEQIRRAIEEAIEQEQTGESRDWHGVDKDVDYTEPDDSMVQRFEELQDMDLDDLDTIKRERDQALNRSGQRTDGVREAMEESGLDREIEEAFRQLKTRDRDVPAERGQHLHVRNAIRHRAGDMSERRLYKRRQRAEVGDRAIGLAVDFSGSMSEFKTKIALAAVATATDIIGDDLCARGFTAGGGVKTPLITAPDEDFEWDHINVVSASGRTSTPAGIRDTRSLLQKASKKEKVLIVITDGKPNVTLEGTRGDAVEQSAQEVRKCKRKGIRVVGMGVGNVDHDKMRQIFGDEYVVTTQENLADDLVEIYRGQMSVA